MIRAELKGTRELVAAAERRGREVRARLSAVVADFALRIEGEAKRRAPVDTGFLRASIRTDLSAILTELAAEVVSGADYSAHLEFGTVQMSARPFLFPSLEAHRAAFVAAVREAVR